MSDDLFAHSANRHGQRHLLRDHLRGTARLARRFGSAFGAGEVTEHLGLLHDVGKGYCGWQDGLSRAEAEGGPVGDDHKQAGTYLASRVMPWQFSGIIEGHHGGLPSKHDLKDLLGELRANIPQHVAEAISRVTGILPEVRRDEYVAPPSWLTPATPVTTVELLIRMAYSAVVDADFLDTAAHFASRAPYVREDADMDALAERFESRRKAAIADRLPSPVDRIREGIYHQALEAADGQPGIYRLHIPTGGGKTFAGAGFALRHAQQHGMRRVIVAVPFISITEQNADIYRRMLDPERGRPDVLEHHSSANLERGWARLAAENWDAPFVITTTVQLFDSLFACKPAQMRKLHRLARSVIVLDEVQALPDRLLIPILSALRTLTEYFGVTVLLSSATQPEFWVTSAFDGFPQHTVVDDPGHLFGVLRRVKYEWRRDVTLAEIASEATRHRKVLIVVNSTMDANTVHQHLGPGAFHLSTRMTSGHRRSTIADIRSRLGRNQDVQVVSTSLIEAGVDLDFPRVYRAWTLPESIQQAAGRCNREGRLDHGTTVVFRPTDGTQPFERTYRVALSESRGRFGQGIADPDDIEALRSYYSARYRAQAGTTTTDPTGGLGESIERLRTELDFPAVADAFQMIDDRSASVIVLRPELSPEDREKAQRAVDVLRSGSPAGPDVLRTLQPHTASIPRAEAEAALLVSRAVPVVGDLIEWTSSYHPQRGIEPLPEGSRPAPEASGPR